MWTVIVNIMCACFICHPPPLFHNHFALGHLIFANEALMRSHRRLRIIGRQVSSLLCGFPCLRSTLINGFSEDSEYGQERDTCKSAIDILPDDALLEVFNFYLDGLYIRRYAWVPLAHVCRRWRYVVFASPRRLGLQVVFTGRRAIADILDVWPRFPILITQHFLDSDKRISRADNIVTALDSVHHDRICEIYLGNISTSLWKRIASVMQKPFHELTRLYLQLNDGEGQVVVPLEGSAPHLQTLSLDYTPIPVVQKFLLSANGLVILSLRNIPYSGYISPEAMASRSPPPLKRSVLPALTSFWYLGVHEYLEDVVARIDAPFLHHLDVDFFMCLTFDVPQLHRFISRAGELRKFHEASVDFSLDRVAIKFSPKLTAVSYGYFSLLIRCEESSQQLLSIVQVCRSLSPPFATSERLYLEVHIHRLSHLHWKDDMQSTQWLELLYPFISVKNLYLADDIVLHVGHALQELAGGRVTEVLPALRTIFISGLESPGSVQKTMGRFVAARQLSGHPVAVNRWEEEREN
ncbi:hypothetical protein F5148DRAFT_1211245 [Russula earlei]|uniref:Uncharacterized protein n=1 Tax=Russula earlei TaxID=71964 RepID=A0ACC0U503_9AGAM|nr:hypothetical protein F5148DRAFT_1211245 [Russula earlei]